MVPLGCGIVEAACRGSLEIGIKTPILYSLQVSTDYPMKRIVPCQSFTNSVTLVSISLWVPILPSCIVCVSLDYRRLCQWWWSHYLAADKVYLAQAHKEKGPIFRAQAHKKWIELKLMRIWESSLAHKNLNFSS